MGMTIYDLLSEEHESTLPIGRAAVKLRTLDREMISPSLWQAIADVKRSVDANEPGLQDLAGITMANARIVTEIVKSWRFIDLEGNEGPLLGKDSQPVHLVLEEVATLPLRFLMMVIAHVTNGENAQGEARPGETIKTSSNGTSPRQVKLDGVQNGTHSSEPQNGSASRPGSSFRGRRANFNGRKRRSS